MLIHELATKTGLSAHAIRFYEKGGLLGEQFIQRGENNYRHYVEDTVERVITIKLLQSAGFTLAEIKTHLETWDAGDLSDDEAIIILEQKRAEIVGKIAELERIKVFLDAKLELLQQDECEEDV
jgi:MerR family transcriptional regulator, copper efflux regulator